MEIRDRIVELRRVKASELTPNPRNWRTHPRAQRKAMQAILEEVGYAGALLARETPAGLELIDGHLRSAITPEETVPVLVLDVTEAEANKILATYDPIAAMAGAEGEKLKAVLDDIDTGSAALQKMLEDLADEHGLLEQQTTDENPDPREEKAKELQEQWGTERGQVWSIGRHRLMCGDSSNEDDVRRLIADVRVAAFRCPHLPSPV